MFGAWVSLCCLGPTLLLEQGVCDDKLMDYGKSWRALAVPQNFSPSSASSMKVNKVR